MNTKTNHETSHKCIECAFSSFSRLKWEEISYPVKRFTFTKGSKGENAAELTTAAPSYLFLRKASALPYLQPSNSFAFPRKMMCFPRKRLLFQRLDFHGNKRPRTRPSSNPYLWESNFPATPCNSVEGIIFFHMESFCPRSAESLRITFWKWSRISIVIHSPSYQSQSCDSLSQNQTRSRMRSRFMSSLKRSDLMCSDLDPDEI